MMSPAASNDEADNDDTINRSSHRAAPAAAGIATPAADDSSADIAVVDDYPEMENASPTALADAEHLDRLEASDAVDDIASFQDIELPPNDKGAGDAADDDDAQTLRASNSSSSRPSAPVPHGVRRAKRWYYCLPMVTQYRLAIGGGIFAIALLAASIAAGGGRGGGDGAAAGERGGEGVVVDDAPAYGDGELVDPYAEWYDGGEASVAWDGDEEPDDAAGGKGQAEGGDGEPAVGASVAGPPTGAPTPSPPPITPFPTDRTDAPPSPGPRWFRTSDAGYQTFLADHDDLLMGSNNKGDFPPHDLAGLFCVDRNLFLCRYDAYCPDGKGGDPREGGPGTDAWNGPDSPEGVQWAAVYAGGTIANDWVQVGSVPASDGGTDGNDQGRCWRWYEWMNYEEVDIVEEWGEDHRRWILCCEEEEEGETGS